MEITEKMQSYLDNLGGLMVCWYDGGVWLPSGPMGLETCLNFVSKGWAVEVMDQGERFFQLTEKGWKDNRDSMRMSSTVADE